MMLLRAQYYNTGIGGGWTACLLHSVQLGKYDDFAIVVLHDGVLKKVPMHHVKLLRTEISLNDD